MFSFIKRRAIQIVHPRQSQPAATVSSYYVTKYAREEFGTLQQLEAGLQDNRQLTPTPFQLLDRLIEAWRAMNKEAQHVPLAYQVGGEWRAIVTQAFQPLTQALEEANREVLDDLLRNFFRRFGDFFGEPTNFTLETQKHRCEQLRLYASRWIDLYGEAALPSVHNPLISNPMGFRINGALIMADSFRHNFYARRMADLADDIGSPVVCEVGGGFGGCAYHLLTQHSPVFKYVDYDIPVMCIVIAYYLSAACPKKHLRLFGEIDSLAEPVRDGDIAILPNFVLPQLRDQSVDICFNTCSFAEMDEATVKEYTQQFERVCRKFILYEDHTWTADSKYAYYRPSGGFLHWNLSAIAPSAALFKRLYKIPAPFHSDFFGQFFEWLYMRR